MISLHFLFFTRFGLCLQHFTARLSAGMKIQSLKSDGQTLEGIYSKDIYEWLHRMI